MNVRLNWKVLFPSHNGQFSVGQNTDIQVEHLRERFVEIFKPEVGTVQGATTKLLLKESASPAFKRARPAHYVLPSAVEEELKRLEREGVLKPEEGNDWATPTVRVPKSAHNRNCVSTLQPKFTIWFGATQPTGSNCLRLSNTK